MNPEQSKSLASTIKSVAIIGGGFGGLTSALFLTRLGIPCTIYEYRNLDEELMGGGFNIAVNGMVVFDALGLADEIKKRGTPTSEFIFLNQSGSVITSFDVDLSLYSQPCVSIWRAALVDIVLTEIKRNKIPIIYKKKLVKLTDLKDSVELVFADGESVIADIVIGADGAKSTVRHHILPDGPFPEYLKIIGIGGIIASSKLSKKVDQRFVNAVNFVFTPPGMLGYGGFDRDHIGWWTNLPREQEFTREQMAYVKTQEIKESLLTQFKDNLPFPLEECIQVTDKVVVHNIHDLPSIPYWFKNRIVLIGDAAHCVSPNSGQGVSMAVEDSMYLAKCFKECESIGDAFKKYEEGRRERVEKTVKEGRDRSGDKKPVSWFSSWIREWFIWFFVGMFGKSGIDWQWNYKIE
jgi:2-polyprenyl-6-methoxyphenol hydroxylase-like FAD-dependent oxidoreductase